MKPSGATLGNYLALFNPLENTVYSTGPAVTAGAAAASYYVRGQLDISSALTVGVGMYAADWLAMYGKDFLGNNDGPQRSFDAGRFALRQAFYLAATLAGGVIAGSYFAGIDRMTAAKMSGAAMAAVALATKYNLKV